MALLDVAAVQATVFEKTGEWSTFPMAARLDQYEVIAKLFTIEGSVEHLSKYVC